MAYVLETRYAGFASVDIGFLGVTNSHVTLSCSQYFCNRIYLIVNLNFSSKFQNRDVWFFPPERFVVGNKNMYEYMTYNIMFKWFDSLCFIFWNTNMTELFLCIAYINNKKTCRTHRIGKTQKVAGFSP